MRNSGLWIFQDPQNLGSPVDYHVTRGFLRLGIVQIFDSTLREKLATKAPVSESEDLAIRRAIYDAVEYVSRGTDKLAKETYHLFWNVFRNCCNRETPHCETCPASDCKLPKRYKDITNGRCMFSDICDKKTGLLEHNFTTDWY